MLRLLVSLRTPVPLLVAGIGIAVAVVAVVALPPQPRTVPPQTENISRMEALTIVASEMRSPGVAARLLDEATVRFDDGAWTVSLGEAQWHFTQRHRIVVADNQAAIDLQYRGPQPRAAE